MPIGDQKHCKILSKIDCKEQKSDSANWQWQITLPILTSNT